MIRDIFTVTSTYIVFFALLDMKNGLALLKNKGIYHTIIVLLWIRDIIVLP